MTALDIQKILIDKYSLSDLQFSLGATIEDLQEGLEQYIIDNEDDIVAMIEGDQEEDEWDN